MGLKQNTSLLAQLPLRQRGGDPGTLRPFWGRTDLRNQSIGQGITSQNAGIPYGHLPPSSWIMPYKPGAVSAYTFVAATFTANLLVGSPSDIAGTVTVTFDSTTAIRGAGNMEGAITPFTELSPQNLAAAVWSALAADYNVTDTMGNKLNLASSGGVDYNALANAVWTAVTATYTTPGTTGNTLSNTLSVPNFLALK